MNMGNDILDFLFGKGALDKASQTGAPPPMNNPPNQNTDYIKAAAQEAAKREMERKMAVKKLTEPTGKKALKILGTK